MIKLIDIKLSKMNEAIVYHVYILHICIYYEITSDMPLKEEMKENFLRRLNRKSIFLTRQDFNFVEENYSMICIIFKKHKSIQEEKKNIYI